MAERDLKSEPNVLPVQDVTDEPEELSKFGSLEVGDGSVPLEPVPLSIEDLPEEILGKIINYLPQTETQIQALRLVCKLWDKTVKDEYHYRVKIEENIGQQPIQPILHQMKHRISRLDIQNLDISVLKPDGTCIFGYPNLIRHLTCSKQYSTGLSPSNLQSVFGLLSTTLRSLDLTFTPRIYYHEFPSNLFYDFEALTQLEVKCGQGSIGPDLDQGPSLLRVLAASTFPKLRVFKGSFDFGNDFMAAKSAILGLGLRLLGASGNSLDSLSLETFVFGKIPARKLFKLEPAILAGLKSIQALKKFEGRGWATDPSEVDPEVINFCKYLLPNNSAGLVSIRLAFDHKTQVDLSGFEACSKLKELALVSSDLEPGTELFNLHRLPESIIDLCISNFKVLLWELEAVLSPPEDGHEDKFLGQVQKLFLHNVYCKGDSFGFSPQVLEKVLTSGSLLEATLQGTVSPDSEDLFAAVLSKLNYSLQKKYYYSNSSWLDILLRRDSSADQWEQGETYYNEEEQESQFDYDSDSDYDVPNYLDWI